ncbi:NAD-dependent epimerase/dehydratase family protein [Paenibacillus alkalitolerans]|uniref:NAD-dependent epimerase/dehydratase family protein n=1 Tax=Paenibacillus alkalitolerans TaxID=2799335 RepID=UPI0018F6CA25|nr:NAD(P)-dependent oxidoreductase [Paenibacillus alkalitolerans]
MINNGKSSSLTALVSGATGYVGSHLARRLSANGWKVHVIARNGSNLTMLHQARDSITVHRHDGSTESMFAIMEQAAPDVVFHLASFAPIPHTPAHIVPMLHSNIVFGTQLVEAMIATGVHRFINTGTFSQHYDNVFYSPASLYDATKQAFKDILTFYTETTALQAITLELHDIYGPGDSRPAIIPILQKAASEQKPVAMTLGEQLVDMVYIDDIADAYELAAVRLFTRQEVKDEVYSVSSQNPIRLKDLVEVFENVTGCRLTVQWGAQSYLSREIIVPWTKGKNLPGWRAKVSLEEGIKKATAAAPEY